MAAATATALGRPARGAATATVWCVEFRTRAPSRVRPGLIQVKRRRRRAGIVERCITRLPISSSTRCCCGNTTPPGRATPRIRPPIGSSRRSASSSGRCRSRTAASAASGSRSRCPCSCRSATRPAAARTTIPLPVIGNGRRSISSTLRWNSRTSVHCSVPIGALPNCTGAVVGYVPLARGDARPRGRDARAVRAGPRV